MMLGRRLPLSSMLFGCWLLAVAQTPDISKITYGGWSPKVGTYQGVVYIHRYW